MLSVSLTTKFRFLAHIFVATLANRIVGLLQRRHLSLSREDWRHVRLDFSQFGEAAFISRFLSVCPPGKRIYIDAGAFHPVLFSNTRCLRDAGWKGIHIEMDPTRFACLAEALPGHHNIRSALSSVSGQRCVRLKYAVGETDRIVMKPAESLTPEERLSLLGREPISMHEETLRRLDEIVAESPYSPEEIGFLNIDCEGHDLEVLRGLSLNACRPLLIAIECHEKQELAGMESYLSTHGYEFHAWFRPTAFFSIRA